jgi:predicted nucleic acid-binding protein
LKVVDASVVVDLLVGDLNPDDLGDEELVAPHLLDTEVLNAVRKLVLRGKLSEAQASEAVNGFALLSITRFPADWLAGRIWALRHNLTAYDATYVALAEMLSATSLLTTDGRLANAPGLHCQIELL